MEIHTCVHNDKVVVKTHGPLSKIIQNNRDNKTALYSISSLFRYIVTRKIVIQFYLSEIYIYL